MKDRFKRVLRQSSVAGFGADVYRLFKNPAVALRLWCDARKTWQEAKFARAERQPTADAPTLLVLSMTDTPYNAKLEAMLSYAVRRHGWHVRILTSRVYNNARRIFKAYGIVDYVNFEDVISNDAKLEAIVAAEIARRADEQMDFQSVRSWTYRGAWIGPQLLSSISRRSFEGAPDPRLPAVRTALLEQLRTSLHFVHAAEGHLESSPPTAVLVNEPNYHVLGPFVDIAIARGLPVIHYTQPSRDDALVFKKLTAETRRIHPNSITYDNFERLLKAPWGKREEAELDEELVRRYGGVWKVQARNQPSTREMNPDQLRKAFDLPVDRPVGVIFSHVLWDANLFYGDDLFENYGEWFLETLRAAAGNPRVSWLVKLHPANIWKRKLSGVTGEYNELRLIREHMGTLPNHMRLISPDDPVSTLSLFRAIDFGVTVRGSVGYELPCFGVPIITAGTGRYSGFGFTMDHTTREDYLAALQNAETIQPLSDIQVNRARIHAHALLTRRPWCLTSFVTSIGDDVTDPLNQNLHPIIDAFDHRPEGTDLDRFAEWLTLTNEIDYMA